ncbi:MAG: DUF4139 domain-containing protein [Patiriisocius sp.]|uniref:DUF4139 domain-containing protein n=1 Tax=Patiriisocius sp. TaxID=2822396 RepID=UPI003EF979A9
MKKQLFLVFLLCAATVFGQTEIDSKIKSVKVFKQNAQIARNATFNATSGTQEIVLTGISTHIVPSSLQIQFEDASAVLLSAKYENNYLKSTTNNKQIEGLKSQMEAVAEELAILEDKKSSYKGMEEILQKNQDLGTGNASFTPQQVIELSNVYETKFLEIRKKLRAVTKEQKPLQEQMANLQKQLNEVNAKFNKPSGNIILKVASSTSKTIAFETKYIVNNAGWNPIYDLRSNGITENVQLNYKANVFQNTGVAWDNISMTVSTGNPSQNNNRPILSPLYANVYEPRVVGYGAEMEMEDAVVQSNMALESRKASAVPVMRSEISENQLSVDFDITSKQTINSDGKENLVALKSYELETEYIYHSVPKLNTGAFLLAKISDWSEYNLVAGNANIFFEGSFVGNSYINPAVTSDELLISMGLDNSIVVERTPIASFKSSKTIGTNKKEEIGYEITVKNKKSVPIKIEILDQVPVSQNKDIEITLDEKGSAEYTEDIGKLLWTLNIAPRQTQKETFVYSVKYPKSKSITGIK